MKVLMLRDDKPGHFNQSEGVIAALRRLTAVDVERVDIIAGPILPARLVRALVAAGMTGAVVETLARLPDHDGSKPDLIVSAGGRTILPNVLFAQRYGVPNIFSGSVRGLPETLFAAILHIDPALASKPRYLIALKPSAIDPDAYRQPREIPSGQIENIALLIGGPTASHPFSTQDLEKLAEALGASALRWRIATSRRTPTAWTDRLERVTRRSPDRITLLDFGESGPGGIQDLLAQSGAAVVTSDSVSMISEAIAFRQPVLALEPSGPVHSRPDDAYMHLMRENGWYAALPINRFSDDELTNRAALCTPMRENHIDLLARKLKSALPDLFSA